MEDFVAEVEVVNHSVVVWAEADEVFLGVVLFVKLTSPIIPASLRPCHFAPPTRPLNRAQLIGQLHFLTTSPVKGEGRGEDEVSPSV